ncbi:MAG: low molecular weight phosphotyrosine protein phosphatase, partial [Komagataeibacter saccharivorans]
VARRHGIDISGYRARVVKVADFDRFTHIIALDASHLEYLLSIRPAGYRAEVSLLMDHVPGMEGRDVVDPYYGSASGFDTTWQDVMAGVEALVRKLQRRS